MKPKKITTKEYIAAALFVIVPIVVWLGILSLFMKL